MIKEELAQYSDVIHTYLANSSGFGIILLDWNLIIQDCNLGFMRMFHPRQKPVDEPLSNFLELEKNDVLCGEELKLPCSRKTGMAGIIHCNFIRLENGYMLLCERLVLTESRALEQIGTMNDVLINLQRDLVKKNHLLEKMKQELDQRVAELETTLHRVKQLEGIIPICMYCKQIRDDRDCWYRLEHYIQDHSEAEFSHSICPTCLEKKFPEKENVPAAIASDKGNTV